MSNLSYKKAFGSISLGQAPAGLTDSIMHRIEAYEIRRLRIRAAFHGALTAVALVLAVPAFKYLGDAAVQSGFGQYLSLMASDSGYVLANFKDFALTLAETMPGTGAIAILAVVLVFANSLRRMLMDLSSLSAFRRRMA